MADPIFPTLSGGMRPDSAQYQVTSEDVSMNQKTEGGYVFSRPRHMRLPRKSWTVGYRNLNDAQKAQLETFWNLVRGGSVIFDWLNHEDNVTYKVRFKSGSGLSFKYRGIVSFRSWDCSFELEQA